MQHFFYSAPQDECEGCRRKSPPGDRSGSQAGVRCRGMSPRGVDDGCSAQVGYLLYGDLQTERRWGVWPPTQKVCGADVPIRFIRFSLLCARSGRPPFLPIAFEIIQLYCAWHVLDFYRWSLLTLTIIFLSFFRHTTRSFSCSSGIEPAHAFTSAAP